MPALFKHQLYCWFETSGASRVKSETCPHNRVQREAGKEVDHLRQVGGRFNKQDNLHTRLVPGHCKISRSLHPPFKILRVYIEAFTRFSHVCHPEHLSNTLSRKAAPLRMASTVGILDRASTPRTGEEPPIAWVQLIGQPVTSSHDLLRCVSSYCANTKVIPHVSKYVCSIWLNIKVHFYVLATQLIDYSFPSKNVILLQC